VQNIPPPPRTTPPVEVVRDKRAVAAEDGVSLYVSSSGYCTDVVVEETDKAMLQIKVQAYRLASPRLAKALVDAHKRGVRVMVLLDGSHDPKAPDITILQDAGVSLSIDRTHAVSHENVVLIDGATVIAQSFFFSTAAEANYSYNVLLLKDKPVLARGFSQTFEEHMKHSVPFPVTAAK
jgi:phosphatidylserine/phosphatidylglycerophosphate/cardiolipin synthase-like enzyme